MLPYTGSDHDVLQALAPVHSENVLDSDSEWCPLLSKTSAGSYSVKIVTSVQSIEDLRPYWKVWAHSLDTDVDYYLHEMSRESSALEPYVIAVYCEDIAVALLVGQIRKRRASSVVSFVTIPGPMERVLEIGRGARIGQPSLHVDRLLALELLNATKRGDMDVVCFDRLPLHSVLFHEIQQLRGYLSGLRVPHNFYYSVLPLSDSDGEGRSGVFFGKTNREIRRKTRILERAFPGQVSLKCFSQPDELDTGMRDALRVAGKTWQSYLYLGLTGSDQTRETYLFLAKQGWLRIYVFYIKDTPCAFLAGQRYDDTFYCQYAGYDPDYARFSVGCLLTARAFEQLAAAGVRHVDLGEGGQEHNRRLGCQMSEEGTVHVYSPTVRGTFLNMFFGSTKIARAGGRTTRLVLRLNWLAKIWKEFRISRWAPGCCLSRGGRRGSEPLR